MFRQQFFDTRERLADVLAEDIAANLQRAIDQRGAASLVVSGGSSPVATFNALSAKQIDWSVVTILPSDERWVDADSEHSNAGMIQRELLRGPAAAARFVSLYDDGVGEQDAAAVMSARVDAVQSPFDYVLLGMGDDGHTASLFPDDPGIAQALASRASCTMAHPPSQPLARISLTPVALLDACAIGLLFFGQAKADVFAAASSSGELAEYPVRCILRQEIVPLTTYHAL